VSGRTTVTAAGLLLFCATVHADQSQKPAAVADLARSFRATEQKLMDAIAKGDKAAWDRVMDPACVMTTEEGQVLGKKQFLEELRPLPAGLAGDISVQDLTVQPVEDVAIVRFLADEWETVFGQRVSTRYRVTDTFRRDGAEWKMLASHVSVVTQDPPAQEVSKDQWPGFVGTYRLLPDGWTLTVELRDGLLYGGRDPKKLRQFIPLAPDVFVLSGSLGEWIFVTDKGAVTHVLNFRKFEPLVWTRVDAGGPK
jgi:Domain of unknown function (DUF4440)